MANISFDEFLRKAGGKPEDVKVVGSAQTETQQPAEKTGGFFQRTIENVEKLGTGIGEVIKKRGEELRERTVEDVQKGEQGLGQTILETFGTFSGTILDVGFEGLKAAGRQLEALPLVGKVAEGVKTGFVDVAKQLAETPAGKAGLEALQKGEEFYNAWKAENKQTAEGLESVLNIVSLVPAEKLVGLGVKGLKAGAELGEQAIKTGAKKVVSSADEALKAGQQARSKVRFYLAEKTIDPKVKQSAERLFLEGTRRLDDPVKLYDKYLDQSKRSLKDIKVDPAISSVGEEIGNAFTEVTKQRQIVGEIMGKELKKIGKVKVDVSDVRKNFKTSLKGAGFEGFDGRDLIPGKTTKMTAEDIDLVERYARELNQLSDVPTISEIDALISRTSNSVSYFKSAKNIVETTNGERLIKESLSNLRNKFDPVKSKNKALAAYHDARKTYAELSDFIDEGAGYLGKLTQTGDFAKDASLAKSSVQSLLNNGRKDWLIKLEALTGRPVLDESVLALQAMKDAGDFRGQSLLQLLSEGAVPTSAPGIRQKLINFAFEKGAGIVAGTPEQRTRQFLNGLKASKISQPKTK